MMVVAGVAVCGCSMDEREWGCGSIMGWFRCGNYVLVVASSCGCNTVKLRLHHHSVVGVFVIWIHNAIAAQCSCGPGRKRNIMAISIDAVCNLNYWFVHKLPVYW